MATKSAGRVSIRVLPDSTRFREDLKKTLDRIERSLEVKIPVVLELNRSQLAEIKRELENLAITIRPDIEVNVPREQIEKIKAQIEALDPEINVELLLSTQEAARRMAELSRDRELPIEPVITPNHENNFLRRVSNITASAAALLKPIMRTMAESPITKHMGAIAGMGYVVSEMVKGLAYLREIDQHAVSIAKMATQMGGVIAVTGAAVQAISGLGAGLVSTLGVLTVAPALLSGVGISVGIMAYALSKMSEELSDLAPAMTELKGIMQGQFWENANVPIRDMVNNLMPALRESISGVSAALGAWTGEAARAFGKHVTPDRLITMMGRLTTSIKTATKGLDPMMEAFTILGLHGTMYLDRMAKATVKLTEDFRDWVKVNNDNGNLVRWTEDAIKAFKDLGGLIGGVARAFGAIDDAAQAAGGARLEDLNRQMNELADIMERPAFQKALTEVFRGMNDAVRQIGLGISSMGIGFASIAPTIEKVFSSIGNSIEVLMGYFGQMMAHPIFQKGLGDLFDGINQGIKNLQPAIEPLTVALGSLMTLLGTVIENVGSLISTLAVEFGPPLQRLSDTFDTLAEPLRVMLEDVIKAMGPAITTLIDEAIIPLLEWIRDDLAPAVSDFAEEVGPGLTEFFGIIGDVVEVLLPILKGFTDWMTDAEEETAGFRDVLKEVKELMSDPSGWVNEAANGKKDIGFWDGLKGMSEDAIAFWEAQRKAGGGTSGALDEMNKEIYDFFIDIGDTLKLGWDNIMSEINSWDWVKAFKKNFDLLKKNLTWDNLKTVLGDLKTKLADWWKGLWDFKDKDPVDVSELEKSGFKLNTAGLGGSEWEEKMLKPIRDWAKNAGETMGDFFKSIPKKWNDFTTSFGQGWDDFWGGLGTAVQEGWEGIQTWLSEAWMNIILGITEWYLNLKTGWDEFWGGLGQGIADLWETIKTNISTKAQEIWDGLVEWFMGLGTSWDEFWMNLGTNLGTLWDQLKLTIATKAQEIWDGLVEWFLGLGTSWDEFWLNLGVKLGEAWETFKTTVSTKIEELKTGLSEKLIAIGTNWQEKWESMKTTVSDKWEAIKSSVSEKAISVRDSIQGRLAEARESLVARFGEMSSNAQTNWSTISSNVSTNAGNIKTAVQTMASDVMSRAREGFNGAAMSVKQKMVDIASSVRNGVIEAVNWFRGLPGQLLGIIQGTSLYQSGVSLISGLISGMQSMAETAKAVGAGIMAGLRAYFPFSPAKKGPFSGTGYTTYSGAALMDGFAEGMTSRMNAVKAATHKVTSSARDGLMSAFEETDKLNGADTYQGAGVVMHVYNPVAEPTSRTIESASAEIRMGAGV